VRSIPDDDLLRRLSDAVRQSRRVEAELVALIAEVEARRLYAREATPSMFAYCTEVLHLSEPEAVLRIRVARASRQHPILLTELREGRLHLSGIALLAPLLTRGNRESLLRRARHKSKEQIRELVAELSPRPDAPSRMRKLPTRTGAPLSWSPAGPSPMSGLLCPDTVDAGNLLSGGEIARTPGTAAGSTALEARLAPVLGSPAAIAAKAGLACGVVPASTALTGPGAAGTERTATPFAPPAPAPPAFPAPSRAATVEPLSPARYKVQFTASAELREKLQRLQALMRSSVPDGDLATIIDAAVTEKLDRLEARRFAKTVSPRKTVARAETAPSSRHIPAPIRRAVHERDGGRCTYEDTRGRRCTERHRLEFHHHGRPFGRGGAHSVENVRLMCREHNQLLAELDYGREKMARFRRAAGRTSGARAVEGVGAVERARGVSAAALARTQVAGAKPLAGGTTLAASGHDGTGSRCIGVGPGVPGGP
jgi:5-methylcytosine-specific restriction endonuclease McrA